MIEGVPSGFEIRSVYDAQGLADACVNGQKLQQGERVVCAIIRPVDQITDTMRIDFLAASGMAVISDDRGNWAYTQDGMQNLPAEVPADITTTFFIEKAEWKPTIREAIDAAILEDMQSA